MSAISIIEKIKEKHKVIGSEIVLEEIKHNGRVVAYISVNEKDLEKIIDRFLKGELDEVKSGWKKYFDKWRKEGIM